MAETGLYCAAGVSPVVMWFAFVLVVVLAFIEGHDEDKWLTCLYIRLPSTLFPPPGDMAVVIQYGHWLLQWCTAFACYALGGGAPRLQSLANTLLPFTIPTIPSGGGGGGGDAELIWLDGVAYVRYLALFLTFIPALALQSICCRCKYRQPIINGLILGLCMYLLEWRALALILLQEYCLKHGVTFLGGTYIQKTLAARDISTGPRSTDFFRRHTEARGATAMGLALCALAGAIFIFGPTWSLVKGLVYHQFFQALSYIVLFTLETFMQHAQKIPRPPMTTTTSRNNTSTGGGNNGIANASGGGGGVNGGGGGGGGSGGLFDGKYTMLMATRALLVWSLLGFTFLCLF